MLRCGLVLLVVGAALVTVGDVVGGDGGLQIDRPRIEVFKAARQLKLYDGETLVRSYRIGLGFEPVADKEREGDGATPEGTFRVCVKNPRSSFYLSLGLNYPNLEDGERGLRENLINQAEFEAIRRADERGRIPPWNTALGGEIYIHGRGSSTDWTLGCVALDDPNMKELFAVAKIGTEVVIKP